MSRLMLNLYEAADARMIHNLTLNIRHPEILRFTILCNGLCYPRCLSARGNRDRTLPNLKSTLSFILRRCNWGFALPRRTGDGRYICALNKSPASTSLGHMRIFGKRCSLMSLLEAAGVSGFRISIMTFLRLLAHSDTSTLAFALLIKGDSSSTLFFPTYVQLVSTAWPMCLVIIRRLRVLIGGGAQSVQRLVDSSLVFEINSIISFWTQMTQLL
ncbi:hypothetical protein MSAN_01910100 [Mycena sanguinolenta]|uniref:Uncharacterized protein n=1 Tax=Mycena sanguinolenta TaxID=230812 RepID=A0A8H6XQL6_9AGAR|nr:hypothetical protein MSAN_01910100 [Mycena sanguinolenta]